ncbi:unnamed protein product [Mycena citricolor]|uniref:Uncharacterized protein n=1 Tax=Mycena citricolor TaxID=2018698 RepID=A0AAD2Q3S5_9AGAR|nr:unnamed protein product [Mycena citricolor]
MEKLSAAFNALKKAASKSKSASIQTVVGQLSSILTLLKLSSSSDNVRNAISQHFDKDNIQDTFSAHPKLMLQFCAAVIDAVFAEKIRPAIQRKNFELQNGWEIVQKSVVDSAFDFVDEYPTKENKSAAATALYPNLCDIFYPTSGANKCINPNIIFNVNEFLLATALDHAENQSNLRSEGILGTKRIGISLSQSREYFELDSLLRLIGVLLPARSASSKRVEFVNAIFTPALFPCHTRIKSLIAASGTEWDPVATQILTQCFAKTHISFPQPFYIKQFHTTTVAPNIVDPLYIDNKRLFMETESDDGMLDVYQVPFSSIVDIALGVDDPDEYLPVTVHLNSPPLIGSGKAQEEKKNCKIDFRLKSFDKERFLDALRARGIGKLVKDGSSANAGRKISVLSEGLSLEFVTPSSIHKPATQQEKVAQVEKLWEQGEMDSSHGEPTSPLLGRSTKEPASDTHHEAISGQDLSEIESDMEKKLKSKAVSLTDARPKSKPVSQIRKEKTARPALDSDDGDEELMAVDIEATRKSQSRAISGKKAVAFSDDVEDEDEIKNFSQPSSSLELGVAQDEDFVPTQPSPDLPPPPVRVTRGAAKRPPVAAGTKKNDHLTLSADEDEAEKEEKAIAGKKKSTNLPAANKAMNVDSTKNKLKGKNNQVVEAKHGIKRAAEDSNEQSRSMKRAKGGDSDIPHSGSAAVFGVGVLAPAMKRYGGKKGRTSSPIPEGVAVDFDELPDVPVPAAPVAVKQEPKKRIGATKGKGGPKVKAMKKAKVKAERTKNDADVKAETADMSIQPVKPRSPKPKPKAKHDKPRKAPWEDMHLRDSSDDIPSTDAVAEGVHSDVVIVGVTTDPVVGDFDYEIPIKGLTATDEDIVMLEDPLKTTATSSSAKTRVFQDETTLVLPEVPRVTASVNDPDIILAVSEFKNARQPTLDAAAAPSTAPRESKPISLAAVSTEQSLVSRSTAKPASPPNVQKLEHLLVKPRQIPPPREPSVSDDSSLLKSKSRTPSVVSPSPLKPRAFDLGQRRKLETSFERFPLQVESAPAAVRSSKERLGLSRRTQDPMQGILEVREAPAAYVQPSLDCGQILHEMQAVMVEKIAARFEGVRRDVRLGRDNILGTAAENLQHMCAESEKHFNTLVDLEEQYASHHRKIISGLDDLQQNSETMADALTQIVQRHDRQSLSKKLADKLFSLPASVRNPVLAL